MKLIEWVAQHPSVIEVEVEEVYDQSTLIGIRFSASPPSFTPGNSITVESPAVSVVAQQPIPNGMPNDYHAPCDSVKCENGKYRLQNGDYNNCFRCNGRGYLTRAKAQSNANWDAKH
tara:strand:+ start:1696 stop:2046 length:351 start_codon:yes stop_codon:yes gene_type:complete